MKKGIVIGAGVSMSDKTLDKLLMSLPRDINVLVTDRMLHDCMAKDITPNRYPNYYTGTNEPTIENFQIFYRRYQAAEKYASQIKVFLSCQPSKEFVNLIDAMGYKVIAEFHRSGKQCGRTIPHGSHYFNTGGNIGTMLMECAVKILNCDVVGSIGIDFINNPSKDNYDNSWDAELKLTQQFIWYHPTVRFYNLSEGDTRLMGKGIKSMDLVTFCDL